MARLKQIKIGVDPLTEAKLTVRAEQARCNVSKYVRDLILKDVSRSGSTDFLLPQLVELGLVTGILVRAQLGHVIGEDEARTIESRARERGTEQLEALLAESGAERA